MSNPAPHPPNQPDPLAVALAKLDPFPHGFDWNALMFAAGRESKARALLFWRVTAGALALLALGLAAALVFQSGPPTVVYIEGQAPAAARPEPLPARATSPEPAAPWVEGPTAEPGSAARWFEVRNELLNAGPDALPEPGSPEK